MCGGGGEVGGTNLPTPTIQKSVKFGDFVELFLRQFSTNRDQNWHLWKWRNDRRSERNLCNCVNKPEKKIQYFNGVWTHDLAIPVRCSSNWALKPLTLGVGQLWVHMFPSKKWVLIIYEINHIFADFNAFLSAMLTMDGFSLTGSSQKLKNPWKSMLSRNC